MMLTFPKRTLVQRRKNSPAKEPLLFRPILGAVEEPLSCLVRACPEGQVNEPEHQLGARLLAV